MISRVSKLLVFVAATLFLTACGEDAPSMTRAEIETRAANAMPTDDRVRDLYFYSCVTCHGDPKAGAPLAGDAQAWAPRLKKGKDVLLQNTINGFEGMPPLGQCFECSHDDFVSLLNFLIIAGEEAR